MTEEQLSDEVKLVGRRMPSLSHSSTRGNRVDLSDTVGDYVLFIYPRTGRPDESDAVEWALIPGAKGCTAESCEFRDLAAEFARIGYSIFGLSTPPTSYQQEAAERLHLPYQLLSDPELELGRQLALEHFAFGGSTLYKRCTVIVRDGVITQAHREIAYPAAHPRELLASLQPDR